MSNNDIRYRLVVPALVEAAEVAGLRSSVAGEDIEKEHRTGSAKGFSISAAAEEERPTAQDAKRRGEIVEVRLALDAMEHDYICAKPYTSEAFDLLVMPRVAVCARSSVVGRASAAKAGQLSAASEAALTSPANQSPARWEPRLKRSPSGKRGGGGSERNKRVKIEIARVQVRSAHVPNATTGKRTPVYKASFTHGSDNRKYTRDDIDVLAVYIATKRLWYIIPFDEVADARTLSFYPDDPESEGQYEKFKERWDLLRI